MTDQEFLNTQRVATKKIDQIFVKEFGKEYIDYRKKWKQSGPDSIPDFPVHLDIEVIDGCNLRCQFCARNNNLALSQNINTGVKFDMHLYEKVLKEGKANNLKAINLGFSGEPLMNNNLTRMISLARHYGLCDVRLITNGLLLNREKIKEILAAGLTFFSISMDAANKETYYKIKGVNVFNRVFQNLKLLYSMREETGLSLPVIRATFYPNPINQKELPAFIKMVKPFTDFVDIQTFIALKNNPKPNPTAYHCTMPFKRLAIFADGKVAPCCAFHSKVMLVGDAKENTLKQIWHSAAVKALRLSLTNNSPNKICQECLASLWKSN